jgi:hypothetical protein
MPDPEEKPKNAEGKPKSEDGEIQDAVPLELREVLQKLPPEQRQVLERSFMMIQGPVAHPLLGKIDKEHLHKMLDGVENDNKRSYEDTRDERKHITLRAVVGTAAFLVACAIFLYAKEVPLLKDILIYLVLIGGGVGIGRGFKRHDDS